MTDSPVACTVVSPAYRAIAKHAVKRMEKFTGLEVITIRCANKDGFEAKLGIDKFCGKRPVLYFDADFWVLRHWEAKEMMGSSAWVTCHDSAVWNQSSFCFKDCEENGLDKFSYFNSGMMMVDFRRQEHRDVFRDARKSWRSKKVKRHDHSDQFHLNAAVMKHRIPITFLHPRHNFYTLSSVWGQYPCIPREIVGLHAAGVPLKMKLDVLRAESSIFGRTHHPMTPDAMRWNFAKQFELA